MTPSPGRHRRRAAMIATIWILSAVAGATIGWLHPDAFGLILH